MTNVRSVFFLPDLPPERSSKVLVVVGDIDTTRLRANDVRASPSLLEGVSIAVHLLLLWVLNKKNQSNSNRPLADFLF